MQIHNLEYKTWLHIIIARILSLKMKGVKENLHMQQKVKVQIFLRVSKLPVLNDI